MTKSNDNTDKEFFRRLRSDGLAAVKAHDASVSSGLYKLSIIFGTQSGQPRQFCVDIACGSGLSDVSIALRKLADHMLTYERHWTHNDQSKGRE